MLFYVRERLIRTGIIFLDMLRALFIFLIVASLSVSIPGNSYAQTPSNIAIFVQIKVQDSSGNLVSYMEASRIAITDLTKLNHLLDQNSPVFQKSFVTNGDQKFEVIKANDTRVHSSATIVSQEIISQTNGQRAEVLAVADHDGYPVVKGDTVTAYWTIIRPAS
jgi:hypothetical protein